MLKLLAMDIRSSAQVKSRPNIFLQLFSIIKRGYASREVYNYEFVDVRNCTLVMNHDVLNIHFKTMQLNKKAN